MAASPSCSPGAPNRLVAQGIWSGGGFRTADLLVPDQALGPVSTDAGATGLVRITFEAERAFDGKSTTHGRAGNQTESEVFCGKAVRADIVVSGGRGCGGAHDCGVQHGLRCPVSGSNHFAGCGRGRGDWPTCDGRRPGRSREEGHGPLRRAVRHPPGHGAVRCQRMPIHRSPEGTGQCSLSTGLVRAGQPEPRSLLRASVRPFEPNGGLVFRKAKLSRWHRVSGSDLRTAPGQRFHIVAETRDRLRQWLSPGRRHSHRSSPHR